MSGDLKFARMWEEKNMRDALISDIKLRNQNEIKITDRKIIEAYFYRYLEVYHADKLQQLIHHPGLLQADLDKITEISNQQRVTQLKVTAGCTIGSLIIYQLFLKKRRMFYDYYRKGRFRMLKRGSSLFFLFIGWANMLAMVFQKQIPYEVHKAGLFKKYFIEYEKVYL